MILGTAGHIDHGKTSLVRALTGVDTDRLPEEKRRGITIDLGFAPLMLDGVGEVGVVDVPGHEAFVRTMVAGATGMDLALLVIAGDAGIMPQTREHLAILDLLGVTSAVVAITKADLVEADWLSLVTADVRTMLADTPFAGAEIVPTSVTAPSGIEELRAALARAASRHSHRRTSGPFRMPIDRAFTMKGTGTVVTGTVWSGCAEREGIVRLFPDGKAVRIRGLQSHGESVPAIRAGQRAAVALGGIELDAVHRGATIAIGDAWRGSRILRADVRFLGDARHDALKSKVRFHMGTAETGARLVMRETGQARIVLDEPVVAMFGDPFVLRSASPLRTIGGGTITDPQAPERAKPFESDARRRDRLLEQMLIEAGAEGLDPADLTVRLALDPARETWLLEAKFVWRVEPRLFHDATRKRLSTRMLKLLGEYHAEHPRETGAPLQWLRSRARVADQLTDAIVAELATRDRLHVADGIVVRGGFTPSLTAAEESLRSRLMSIIDAAAIAPPSFEELGTDIGVSPKKIGDIARVLERHGALVAVEENRFYSSAAVSELKERMRSRMTSDREYAPTEIKEFLGLTRKFTIPFLEYCDRTGYTFRGTFGRRLVQGVRVT
jgi:selenocysteine-specific elongation factor